MEPSLLSFTYSECLALKELYPHWNTYRLAAVSDFSLKMTYKNIADWINELIKVKTEDNLMDDSILEFIRELLNARQKFFLEMEYRKQDFNAVDSDGNPVHSKFACFKINCHQCHPGQPVMTNM